MEAARIRRGRSCEQLRQDGEMSFIARRRTNVFWYMEISSILRPWRGGGHTYSAADVGLQLWRGGDNSKSRSGQRLTTGQTTETSWTSKKSMICLEKAQTWRWGGTRVGSTEYNKQKGRKEGEDETMCCCCWCKSVSWVGTIADVAGPNSDVELWSCKKTLEEVDVTFIVHKSGSTQWLGSQKKCLFHQYRRMFVKSFVVNGGSAISCRGCSIQIDNQVYSDTSNRVL